MRPCALFLLTAVRRPLVTGVAVQAVARRFRRGLHRSVHVRHDVSGQTVLAVASTDTVVKAQTTIDDAGTSTGRCGRCSLHVRSVFTLLPVSYNLGVCRFVRTPRADARPHLRGRVGGVSRARPPPSRCRARLAVKPRGSPALARRSAARRASAEPGASARPSRGGWRLVTGVVAWGFTWGSSSVSLLYLVSKDRRICKAICT